MILLEEYHGVLYTIETWSSSRVRIAISFYPSHPDFHKVKSVGEARIYCREYIESRSYQLAKNVNFAHLYGAGM